MKITLIDMLCSLNELMKFGMLLKEAFCQSFPIFLAQAFA